MKVKRMVLNMVVLAALLLLVASITYAQDETAGNSDWGFSPYVDVSGGLGVIANYSGFSLFPEQATKLYVSLCGNYNSGGFFRNPDGTEFAPTDESDFSRGFYKKSNYGLAAGITQELFPKLDNESQDTFQAFLFYKYRKDQYLQNESPANSLIFLSGLPDQAGIAQTTILTGLLYGTMSKSFQYQTQQGLYSTISWEVAPTTLNDCADFSRFNFGFSGFVTLLEGEDCSIDMGDRIIYDRLTGNYIPINARTSFGGFNTLSGVSMPGLGGGVRGIPMGRFDSETKYLNNLEMRMHFPSLINEKLIPGMIVYSDFGKTGDSETVYSSAGAGLWLHNRYILEFDLIFYYNRFFNENFGSFNLVIGSTHF